jgi:plasmid stabilization system protein ParE
MKVEYSQRAIADIRQIALYYSHTGDPSVAEKIAAQIQEVIARIAVLLSAD